jgi:hypothetical protein
VKIQSGVLGFSLAEHIEGVTQGCERVISGVTFSGILVLYWVLSFSDVL